MEEDTLISGVKKGKNYYIAIHGKSYNDIKNVVKIKADIIENGDAENQEDIIAVISMALKDLI